jgi:hypothetical protein
MVLLDLFGMAEENAARLASACADHVAVVVEFARSVETEGRLSITMRFDRLRDFLGGGRYLNPWEECCRDAGGDETKAEQMMSDRQGPKWHGRRAHFEGSFAHGKRFRYGALTTGGRALVGSKYGPFCSVFRAEAAAAWKRIAWLPANSLEAYVSDEQTFEVERLRGDVGAHGSRHQVAAIKHAGDVAAYSRQDWPTLLCHGDRFVEGIVAEDLVPDAVERLLVDTALWKSLQDAADAVLDGDEVGPQIQADASRFAELRAALGKWSLSEETI